MLSPNNRLSLGQHIVYTKKSLLKHAYCYNILHDCSHLSINNDNCELIACKVAFNFPLQVNKLDRESRKLPRL